MLEHFTISLCYDYNAPTNHADLLLTTKPSTAVISSITVSRKYSRRTSDKSIDTDSSFGTATSDRRVSIDFDLGRLELFSVPIPLPTAIHPMQQGSLGVSANRGGVGGLGGLGGLGLGGIGGLGGMGGVGGQGDAPYSLVFSYEDLLFTVSIVREFMGLGVEGEGET